MPGKFALIQPRSRLALMSLIRRRLGRNAPWNRSVQGSLSPPVSTRLAGPRNSSRRSSGLRYCLGWKPGEGFDLARVKGLEDVAVPAPVVDDVGEPRGTATPGPGEKHRAPVVPLSQVQVEPAEQPVDAPPDHRPTAGIARS